MQMTANDIKLLSQRASVTVAAVGSALALPVLWSAASATAHEAARGAPVRADEVLAAVVAVAALAAVGWLAVGLLLEVLSLLPGAGGRAARGVADVVTPRLVRRAAAVALGAGVAAGLSQAPAVAGPPAPVAVEAPNGRSGSWPDPVFAPPPTTDASEVPGGDGALAGGATVVPAPATSSSLPDPGFGPPPTPATARPPSPASGPPPDPTSGPAPGPPPDPPAPASPGRASPTRSEASGWVPGPPAVRTQPDVRVLSPAPRPDRDPDGPHVVVVRRGDCLWSIAARHLGANASDAEIARAWPRWFATNREVIGDDPGLLHPGQLLRVPEEAHS